MKFSIAAEIFEHLPQLCVGVVFAKNIDNTKNYPEITALLSRAVGQAEQKFSGKKVKEEADILPYREAFSQLKINPNKYLCSIEALFTRITKGKGMPHINPLVDLNNAVSLAYPLPMGTHDLGDGSQEISLRFSVGDDRFLPFGGNEWESPDSAEPVYAVGNEIRTRRWTWRQSENGKIDGTTKNVFFPIDGFVGINDDRVKQAAAILAEHLRTIFNADVQTAWVDRENRSVTW